MRANRTESVQGAPPEDLKRAFSDALARARLGPAVPAIRPVAGRVVAAAPSTAAASRAAGHLAIAVELQRARAGHAAEASRLHETRADRTLEGVKRGVATAPERDPPAPRLHPTAPAALEKAAPAQEPTAPVSRAGSTLQLLERIEVFLCSRKPRLELTVGGLLDAVVLLERTGPREVAVTVRGRNGPPPPQELSRVREELGRRGLRLSSLAIGRR